MNHTYHKYIIDIIHPLYYGVKIGVLQKLVPTFIARSYLWLLKLGFGSYGWGDYYLWMMSYDFYWYIQYIIGFDYFDDGLLWAMIESGISLPYRYWLTLDGLHHDPWFLRYFCLILHVFWACSLDELMNMMLDPIILSYGVHAFMIYDFLDLDCLPFEKWILWMVFMFESFVDT
jgi:hypothetical protein